MMRVPGGSPVSLGIGELCLSYARRLDCQAVSVGRALPVVARGTYRLTAGVARKTDRTAFRTKQLAHNETWGFKRWPGSLWFQWRRSCPTGNKGESGTPPDCDQSTRSMVGCLC